MTFWCDGEHGNLEQSLQYPIHIRRRDMNPKLLRQNQLRSSHWTGIQLAAYCVDAAEHESTSLSGCRYFNGGSRRRWKQDVRSWLLQALLRARQRIAHSHVCCGAVLHDWKQYGEEEKWGGIRYQAKKECHAPSLCFLSLILRPIHSPDLVSNIHHLDTKQARK